MFQALDDAGGPALEGTETLLLATPKIVVCTVGRAGSGKDTFASRLVDHHKFTRVAFADPLKMFCAGLFHAPIEWFHDRDMKESMCLSFPLAKFMADSVVSLAASIDEFAKLFGINEKQRSVRAAEFLISFAAASKLKTDRLLEALPVAPSASLFSASEGTGAWITSPRIALQIIGTEVFRNHFSEDFWLQVARSRIAKTEGHIVLTDARFKNEFDLSDYSIGISRDGLIKLDHASENAIDGLVIESDFKVSNNGSIEDLFVAADAIADRLKTISPHYQKPETLPRMPGFS